MQNELHFNALGLRLIFEYIMESINLGFFEWELVLEPITVLEELTHLRVVIRKPFQWLQEIELARKVAVNYHARGFVVKFAAVVGGTKNGYKITVVEELISVYHDLMGSANEVQVILF